MDSASGTVPEEFTAKQLKDSLVYLDLDDMNGKDSYGRWVAVVYLSKSDGSLDTGRNFNRMLVDGGQACIWDFDNNEFNPASWWNWSIPSSACVKSESSVGTDIFRSPPWMERDRYSSEGSPQAEDAGHTYSGFNAGGSYYGSAGSSSVGSAGTGSFVGSARSDKYHYPSCEWAQKISPSNEVWFSSPQDARASGYVPCKVCRPP
jgi:micrococcal nuclease